MIKIGLRNNLFYLLMLTIFNFLRNIDTIVMISLTGLNSSLLLTILMFLGEFVAGFFIFIYQIRFLQRHKRIVKTFMGIELIQASSQITYPDSNIKICFLIFIASYFDFVEFTMATLYIPRFKNISISLAKRLTGMLIISAALLSYHFLKLPMFRHQIFSLSIVLVCFLIVLFTEFFFRIINDNKEGITNLLFVIFLIFINHFFTAFKDVIEKYLLEVDYINPFKLLMLEGLFGFIISSLYSFKEEPFSKIKNIYDQNYLKYIILIITLFFFFFFSGGRNAYRIITNKLYSPMTRTLTDCFLDPLLITYFFIVQNDFKIEGNQKQTNIYFIINLIISIIIVFCGCVYNELLVLSCCNLAHNTHYNVSIRASNVDSDYQFGKNGKSKSNKKGMNHHNSDDDISEENTSEENTLAEKISDISDETSINNTYKK